jgi:hypothetical protein
MKARLVGMLSNFLVLLALIISACGGSDKIPTSIDPADLEKMTEGFTKGSGEINSDIVNGIARVSPLMFYSAYTLDNLSVQRTSVRNYKTGSNDAAVLGAKPVAKFLNLLFNTAIIGSPTDKLGVTKSIINKLGFNASSIFRVTGDQITVSGDDYPDCFYIDGLSEKFENYLKGTWSPTELELAQEVEKLMSDFDVTFGYVGRCLIKEENWDSEQPAVDAQGSVNIKGSIDMDADQIKADFTATFNNLVYTGYSSYSEHPFTEATYTGALSFKTKTKNDGKNFNFYFTIIATDFLMRADPAGNFGQPMHFSADGAMAALITAPAVKISDSNYGNMLEVYIYPYNNVVDSIYPEYLVPDLCSMTVYVVVDMTISAGDEDPNTESGAEASVLFGFKVSTASSSEGEACSGGFWIDSVKYVYFYSQEQFYIVDTDERTPLDPYVLNVKGGAGYDVNISIDQESETDQCVVTVNQLPEGVEPPTCTFQSDFMDGSTLLILFLFFYVL